MTLPLRLIILHFSHIGFTEGLTFICDYLLLASPSDSAAGDIIGRHLNGDFVSGENSDEIHAEFSRDVSKNDVSVADIHSECCVGQGFNDRALKFDYIVFCQIKFLQVGVCVVSSSYVVCHRENFRFAIRNQDGVFIVR